jgi:protein gp37
MERDKKRYGQDPNVVVRSKDTTFFAPNRWKEPGKVFVCSWSDFFIEEADEWRREAYKVMLENPHLTFMLLTKRAENILDRLPPFGLPENVWLGITVENQDMLHKRMPFFKGLDAPIKFLSIEPMLEDINLYPYKHDIDWVIVGCESGPNAREMKMRWVEDIAFLCYYNGIPLFFKQAMVDGKLTKLPDLAGQIWNQFPKVRRTK